MISESLQNKGADVSVDQTRPEWVEKFRLQRRPQLVKSPGLTGEDSFSCHSDLDQSWSGSVFIILMTTFTSLNPVLWLAVGWSSAEINRTTLNWSPTGTEDSEGSTAAPQCTRIIINNPQQQILIKMSSTQDKQDYLQFLCCFPGWVLVLDQRFSVS